MRRLLGSATPSLESFQNALTGKYELLRMTKRTDDKSMPLIRIVDIRLQRRKGQRELVMRRSLSERLRAAITGAAGAARADHPLPEPARFQHLALLHGVR